MNLISIYGGESWRGADLGDASWNQAEAVMLDRYWSGEKAPEERQAEVRSVWSSTALYLKFDCRQGEPLVVSLEPKLEAKTIGLWERDVCEAFVKPGPGGTGREPRMATELARDLYYEFEAAPTSEWLDLAIQPTGDGRITDWEYRSGFTVTSEIEPHQVTILMRIPWSAFGRVPVAGERWRANFFRCVGTGEDRGYLAWQPTLTEKPNFHVPDMFGELIFRE